MSQNNKDVDGGTNGKRRDDSTGDEQKEEPGSDNPGDHTDQWSKLRVSSLEDLDQHEPEILERIKTVPNGGNRFMAHPFALLSDINVDVSPGVRTELEERIPELTGLSKEPYQALVGTKADQPIRFHMQGLFPDEEEKQR